MAGTPNQINEKLSKQIEEQFDTFVDKATKLGMISKVVNIRNKKPIDKYTYLTELLFRNPVFIDKDMLILMTLVERQCINYGYDSKTLSEATVKAMKI